MAKFRKGQLAVRALVDPKTLAWLVQEVVTVTDVYSDYQSRFGPYPELYEVVRPNGETVRGILPHGLVQP